VNQFNFILLRHTCLLYIGIKNISLRKLYTFIFQIQPRISLKTLEFNLKSGPSSEAL
jgi:hypothetical protein